jgi:hypothetical protein
MIDFYLPSTLVTSFVLRKAPNGTPNIPAAIAMDPKISETLKKV